MMRPAPLLLLCAALLAPPVAGQGTRWSMDPGWRFTRGDPTGAEQPRFDDRAWRRLDVPHDWSIEGTPREDAPGGGRVGYFPNGTGWYRKTFRLPTGALTGAVWLEFDGVYMNSDVWLNGVHLGRRPYGYASFAYDITRQLRPGDNVVAVRVDNAAEPNSRWYTGSGTYRHVWLRTMAPLHLAHWGTFVTTPRADSARAEIAVRTRIENDGAEPRQGVLASAVVEPGGGLVTRVETPFSVGAGQTLDLEQTLTLDAPRLWSVESPHLYTLRSVISDGGTRAVTHDLADTPFGIRSTAWDADRGFLLNGRSVKLRGVNLHHDAGGLGAAVPERETDEGPLRWLFGEGPGGYVLSGERAALEALASEDLEVFVCGEVGGDRIAIARYLGRSTTFDGAMTRFAATYADQNERDYAEFKAAVEDGRLEAITDE